MAVVTLLFAIILLGAGTTFIVLGAKPTLGAWVFSGFCLVMGLACIHSAIWHTIGSCEMVISSTHFTLHQRCGPLKRTKNIAIGDIRKVERVEQVNSRNGRRTGTLFYVFGPGRPWRFGYSLSEPAADHLWADLSRGWKSSTRIEKVDPAAD